MDYNENADIAGTGGGSGTGIAAMINNEVDIAQAFRAMTDDELSDASGGGKITVYSRQSNSGTYVYANENVMEGGDFAPGAMFMPGFSAIREAVEQEPNAIDMPLREWQHAQFPVWQNLQVKQHRLF